MKKQINFTLNNKKIYGYIWEPESYDKVMILVHGMAEHIDRYDGIANALNENGFLVIGYNQRGHKFTTDESEYGYMGEEDNFEILVSDLNQMVKYAKENYPNKKYFVLGHSMGSFVTNRFLEEYEGENKVSKAILCATGRMPKWLLSVGACLCSIIRIFKGKKHASKLMDKMSFGSYNKAFEPVRTPFDWLNRDEAEVDKYINDDACGRIFSVKYFHDFLLGCKRVTNKQKLIRKDIPILLIAGDKDPVGDSGKAVAKLNEVQTKLGLQSTLKLIPDNRHEILLEKDKLETYKFIINWLNQ